jgi:hypothetical protein
MGEFVPAQLFRIDIRYGDLDPRVQLQLKKDPRQPGHLPHTSQRKETQ